MKNLSLIASALAMLGLTACEKGLVDGSLICYYSLNNPVTDARYSGQLTESCSLVA